MAYNDWLYRTLALIYLLVAQERLSLERRRLLRTGHISFSTYSRSSLKRPPREFEKVVVTRSGRLQECALVSDPMVKQ